MCFLWDKPSCYLRAKLTFKFLQVNVISISKAFQSHNCVVLQEWSTNIILTLFKYSVSQIIYLFMSILGKFLLLLELAICLLSLCSLLCCKVSFLVYSVYQVTLELFWVNSTMNTQNHIFRLCCCTSREISSSSADNLLSPLQLDNCSDNLVEYC